VSTVNLRADSVPTPSTVPLGRLERWGLVALMVLFVGFGFATEVRSAFMRRPMTDLQVYLRAAWAARTGGDIYAITDDNGWHYHYPPLLAIALIPLADAPAGIDRVGIPSFALSVALWYAFSLACLAFAVHTLASALEATRPKAVAASARDWWRLRVLPVVICLPAIGATLARGQVNLLVLALLCLALAAILRGQSFRAGLWLAAAICVKLIPALLILYPLWRRDVRCLVGIAVGLLVGLVLIPAVWFGPREALDCYREWTNVLVRPALGQGNDQSRAKELINVDATDNQSLLAILHNNLYPDRVTRPTQPDPAVRLTHWLLGGILTVLCLVFAGRKAGDRLPVVLSFGALLIVMVMMSPVCHMHYFCLAIPLVMGLMSVDAERSASDSLSPGLKALLAINFVGSTIPHLPEQPFRDAGLVGVMGLVLWAAGCVVLWRLWRLPSTPDRASVTQGRIQPVGPLTRSA
jgi:alpha-1,2-mannosyltransferase